MDYLIFITLALGTLTIVACIADKLLQ